MQTEIQLQTNINNQYFISRSMNNRTRYNICKQDGRDHYITLDTDLEFDYAVAAVELLNNSLENKLSKQTKFKVGDRVRYYNWDRVDDIDYGIIMEIDGSIYDTNGNIWAIWKSDNTPTPVNQKHITLIESN